MELQYKSCYARILDAKMKFTEASLRYYELSQTELGRDLGDGKVVTESDLAASLTSAIIACILAALLLVVGACAQILSEALPWRFFAALGLIMCGLIVSQWKSLKKFLPA